ncbi:hypothetical protein TWF788_006990 [Orbilia oligospora]|uniref:Uncharacterized protein n=1 Tax=Orbilia oligospora TaxID=2813651 RepID=A0A6G1M5Z6_ORBOL|nr:hypothetical protein TWF788_006990 [Orbilia oligospora]KAF3217996.1 hypothetical protein TWF679_001409 [Orbilia oligospora]KAF3218714.1 hypothetical protein TWF191_008159 [Orbilia oligospora]KAF3244234.1 hypothetical protein TWF192_007795 [Orbilia oligospora]
MISRLPPPPMIPPPPTTPEITFTVRGIRLVNREWSLRDASFPITITNSATDPTLSATEASIMLREDAVGLYHHNSKTYIPIRQIYLHSEYLTGSEESLRSRSSSRASSTRSSNGSADSDRMTSDGKVVWDVVYRRPRTPASSASSSCGGSTFSFEMGDDCDGDEESVRGKKLGKWADIKRCAWILWDGTYVFLSIKRPLVYIEDLQRGMYSTTWRERGRKKVGAWFGRNKGKEEFKLC